MRKAKLPRTNQLKVFIPCTLKHVIFLTELGDTVRAVAVEIDGR